MGPIGEAGVLEHCRFLPIRFDRWRAQLTTLEGALRWVFGHTSASVKGECAAWDARTSTRWAERRAQRGHLNACFCPDVRAQVSPFLESYYKGP